jgi:type II secretory pathway component PulK
VLDFFGYNPVSSSYPRAGIVNLNTKNASVLAAIIKGALSQDGATNYVGQTAATNAAQAIVTATNAEPALKRADVARLAGVAGGQIGSTEEQKETIARALAEVAQTRTWNLFIDVITQTGKYAPGTASVTEANKFTVEGEKRYWFHISLDRDDGTVLGTQLEEVIE